jgi:hypothetical protein
LIPERRGRFRIEPVAKIRRYSRSLPASSLNRLRTRDLARMTASSLNPNSSSGEAAVAPHDQYQIGLPESKPVITHLRVPVTRCSACRRRVQGLHREQTFDAYSGNVEGARSTAAERDTAGRVTPVVSHSRRGRVRGVQTGTAIIDSAESEAKRAA